MKCGEFDKRNEYYADRFSVEDYFMGLVFGANDAEGQDCSAKIIFDVGAHKGESAVFFHELFPDARIYSFEPNPVGHKEIIDLNIGNVISNQIALSDVNGDAVFNIQDISHLSSLHKINKESVTSLGYSKRENHKSINVMVSRGDTFMAKNDINKIDFLKIDAQAHEVNVIKGFSGVIEKINVVFVEVSLYDFYEKKSSIKLIEESLPNFELFDIYEISKNPKTMGTDWVTLVYKNKNYLN